MMPAFTGVLRMPIKLAIGSSLVAVAMFSIPALITHTVLGHIAWRFALPLMIGVVPGAQVGAHISVGSSDRTMRLLFGSFILVPALVRHQRDPGAAVGGWRSGWPDDGARACAHHRVPQRGERQRRRS
jgi:uncharacterized membrane protein YfcA